MGVLDPPYIATMTRNKTKYGSFFHWFSVVEVMLFNEHTRGGAKGLVCDNFEIRVYFILLHVGYFQGLFLVYILLVEVLCSGPQHLLLRDTSNLFLYHSHYKSG